MFLSKSVKNHKGRVYASNQLLPLASRQHLIGSKDYQVSLSHIQTVCMLDVDQFHEFYDNLITAFSEFVQLIPARWEDPLGSLLSYSFDRALRVLFHFIEEYPDSLAVERYAIFSCALLKDVSAVYVNQKVLLTDEKGFAVEEWLPMQCDMLHAIKDPQFYRMLPTGHHYERMATPITLLLARQLMPEHGFLWIAEYPDVLAEWLAVLTDDEGGAGRFIKIFRIYLQTPESKTRPVLALTDIDPVDAGGTKHAEEFLEWVRDKIAKGELDINGFDANILMLQEGLFLDEGIFKQFVDLYAVPVNMFVVFQQFGNLMGLTKLSGADYRIEQLFSKTPNASNAVKQNFLGKMLGEQVKHRRGMLVQDPAVIFKKDMPNVDALVKSKSNSELHKQRQPRVLSNPIAPKPKSES